MTSLIGGLALLIATMVMFRLALPGADSQPRSFLRTDRSQALFATTLVGLSGAGLVLTLAGLAETLR